MNIIFSQDIDILSVLSKVVDLHTTIKNQKSINIFKCIKIYSTSFVFVVLYNSEPAVPRITSYKAYSCKTDLNNETRWNLLLTTS